MTASDDTRSQRIDKWLWHARFFRTRSLAARICNARKVRINGRRITKAGQSVTTGDFLTFPQGNRIRVVEVISFAERRCPASEARTLYADHSPQQGDGRRKQNTAAATPAAREPGSGRPTKAQRRAIDKLMRRS